MSWFKRLREGLKKTTASLGSAIGDVFSGGKLDAETLENLEDILIQSDLGLEASGKVIETLKEKAKSLAEKDDPEALKKLLADTLSEILTPRAEALEITNKKPFVLVMNGVNGSGKTTTIGKLSSQYKRDGKKVLLAAADTFRAGAVAQLQVWADRAGVPIVAPEKEGVDPATIAYKAHEKAIKEGYDILIIDTAGRLQNRHDLMEQLAKLFRTIKKQDESAPHASLLVLDATVGQNAFSQVDAFKETAEITGLVMTKLDSSAKGGVMIGLADKYALPIHYIGVGEGIEDLQPFDATEFCNLLVGINE